MSKYLKCIYCIIINLVIINSAQAWDSDQLEIFDLVEEVNQNFYNLLNISQDADLQAIKKAFRGQSLILHPDKNDAPDAEVRFRNLVSVYEVLRDPGKRAHYDDVLKNGLPNWKSAVYYYRHVRKMGLMETLATLFVVITIGQYLVAWGAYVEKKYTAEQVYGAKIKKQQRKRGAVVNGDIPAELIEMLDIRKPSFRDTLPIQIPKVVWFGLKESGPATIRLANWLNERRKEHANKKAQEEEESSDDDTQEQRVRTVRKRKPGFVPVERDDSELPPRLVHVQPNETGTAPVAVTGGLWTDDDLAELVQLVKKYPGGTTDRWEKIAETMNRTVSEVTYMANKLKDNFYRVPGQEEEKPQEYEIPRKQKTKGGKLGLATIVSPCDSTGNSNINTIAASWSQIQQKAFEAALAKYPKGPSDRWEKIAKCVPEKTKDECILRYKYLVEMVKKQKEKKDNNDAEEQ